MSVIILYSVNYAVNQLMNKIIQKNPNVCATFVDGELVVMSAQDNIYYKINASGIKIWELMEANVCSVQHIVAFIANYYQVPQERVQPDVEMFIDVMLKKNIVYYVSC